jgi:uncharacterized membrane protein
MPIVSVAHVLLALTLVALGVQGFLTGDFTAVWEPVPKAVPARAVLIYLCAAVSLGCGVGLLLRRSAASAARVLLGWLLLWLLLFRLPVILRAPATAVSWEGCGESVVIVAGAWVLYARRASAWDRRRLAFAVDASGMRIARVLFGLALIPLGVAHLAYIKETASLVPGWLPAHELWACITGGAYIAAGVAVLSGVWARLAATLAAVQMGLFTLLVWVPIVAAAGPKDHFQWSETWVSWALTVAAWVVADSYRGTPWRASRRR